MTPYTEHSHGFTVQEPATREFQVEKAQSLGIEPGPKYGKLQNGDPVETADGQRIEPEEVLSEPQSGRKIVYTSDTRPTPEVIDAATDASLLISSAMFTEELADRARSTGHSTAMDVGRMAAESGSNTVWLTHISPRHEDDEQTLESEASQEFDGDVTVVRDGYSTEI
jgi:Metal-dependent hydrolases of the beta-lactamase superfamily III